MSTTKIILRTTVLTVSVLPMLALAACGDGWEVKPYEGVPYTHERTAGRGIEYVRASMMPAKSTNTEVMMKKEEPVAAPVVTPPPPEAEAVPAPAKAADKIFNNKQAK